MPILFPKPQTTTTISETKPKSSFLVGNIILRILSRLLAFPLFILVYRMLPSFNIPWHLDKIILFIIIALAIHSIFKIMKKLTLWIFASAMILLLIGSLSQGYGFKNMAQDYIAMIYTMMYGPIPASLDISKLKPFPNQRNIRSAIDFTNPKVRDFSLRAINLHFREESTNHPYRNLIQCMAVFKEINNHWNYVNDPKSRDYYAKASESVEFLAGDCDDHSTCMAACIKAIGGTTRLVLTTKHLYPELFIGYKKDLEHVNYLVRKILFAKEAGKEALHYHIDEDGKIWINLDYTSNFPGGKFMAEEILGILNV